jgi:hypothetical protein
MVHVQNTTTTIVKAAEKQTPSDDKEAYVARGKL